MPPPRDTEPAHLAALHRLSAALTVADSVRAVLAALAHEARAAFGAPHVSLALAGGDEGALQVLRSDRDGSLRLPAGGDEPLVRALREGRASVRPPRVAAPLVSGGRAIGAVEFDAARDLDAGDLALLSTMSALAAAVVDRVRSQERARRDLERQRFLAHASELLGGSLDPDEMLARVAAVAVPTLADRAAVDRLDPGGARRVAEVGGPVRAGFRVPIRVRGDVRAELVLARDPARPGLGAADTALAHDLARQAGLALETALLHGEVQDAQRRKDEFLALLGHELRNPLGAIRSAVGVLASAGAIEEEQARARAVLVRQVGHMARLLEDLLDLSRVTVGRLTVRQEPVDLATIVRETVEDHETDFARAGITPTVILPPHPVPVRGDRSRLAQVLGNLLQNAVKFTDPGGRITVRLELANAEVVLSVEDTGVGIDPAVLGTVFQPFVQGARLLDRARGGLGLGLAIVQQLVELHGGRVRAESAGKGKGARFVVTLPLAAGPGPLSEERPTEGVSRRVLVVEDNPDAATMLHLLLELAGHEVEVAGDGPAALIAARTFRPEVVLCDIGLPGGMDGYAVARALREEPAGRDAFLVALTGYGQERDQQQALAAGFDRHVTKPVDPEVIERIVLEHRRRT